MLFNSYEFIFLLLPIAWLGNRLLAGADRARVIWLLACSLFFYAWWNPIYLPLLLASIGFNFVIGEKLQKKINQQKALLIAGIAANVLLLAYFKYAIFIAGNIEILTGARINLGAIALPLAISFYTFQQIAYLVDCYKGLGRRYDFWEYALFVTFFPQLIAGPIVHHAEMMPQLRENRSRFAEDFAVGVTIFAIGLFKKAILADGIAPHANALFNDPQAWQSPTLIHAWIGTLAYGFQIYFDFSGYSDMAVGAARLFGIQLPLNFFAPYRATTISDFWRRWHMTLSRFLRDYLYIPLGGNRYGTTVRYRNLMITMLLGGLWHGAGWTFVLWGLLHGLYLVIQQFWSRLSQDWHSYKATAVYRFAACCVTLAAVHFAWVYFRAESLHSANRIVQGMIGWNGISIPNAIAIRLGIDPSRWGIGVDSVGGAGFVAAVLWIAYSFFIIWTLPTTQEFVGQFEPTFEYTPEFERTFKDSGFGWRLSGSWQPTLAYALFIATIGTAGILSLPEVSEFLYFQF